MFVLVPFVDLVLSSWEKIMFCYHMFSFWITIHSFMSLFQEVASAKSHWLQWSYSWFMLMKGRHLILNAACEMWESGLMYIYFSEISSSGTRGPGGRIFVSTSVNTSLPCVAVWIGWEGGLSAVSLALREAGTQRIFFNHFRPIVSTRQSIRMPRNDS